MILKQNLCDVRWDKDVYQDWIAGVDEACSFNLNRPLISRNEETKLISVNFDQKVINDKI